jgi:hypothetical protein
MPTTTPCVRASSRPSNANCSSAAGSGRRQRREAQCSPSSRASTIRAAVFLPRLLDRTMRQGGDDRCSEKGLCDDHGAGRKQKRKRTQRPRARQHQVEREAYDNRGQTEERIREQDQKSRPGNRQIAKAAPHGNPTTAATAVAERLTVRESPTIWANSAVPSAAQTSPTRTRYL